MKMVFRLLSMMIWAIILGILTCSINLEAIFRTHTMQFIFNARPDFSDLFALDLTQIHPKWVFVKIGHLVGFGIMDILIFNVFRKHKPALLMAILFAASTEIFQLYFNRDGRLYDIIIDVLGAILSYYAAQIALHYHPETKISPSA